jgi:hypothetical protein
MIPGIRVLCVFVRLLMMSEELWTSIAPPAHHGRDLDVKPFPTMEALQVGAS